MSWYFPAKSRLTHSARPTCWKHCTVRLPSRSAACKPGAPPSDQREYNKSGILNTAPKPVFTAYVQPVYHADGSDDVTRYRRPMAISTAWMLLMPSEDDLRRVTTRGYRSTGVELVTGTEFGGFKIDASLLEIHSVPAKAQKFAQAPADVVSQHE